MVVVYKTTSNNIKYQAERLYLAAAVEIGRRLTEAKALLKYGEWGKWLEESVDFSQSRANKLMRIFKEYGAEQLTGFESEFKLQPGGASFRYPKGGTGAIHHRYGYRGNDQSRTQESGQ